MPSINKPRVAHPSLKRNDVGLAVRDYEGSMSTLVRRLCGLAFHYRRIDTRIMGAFPSRRI